MSKGSDAISSVGRSIRFGKWQEDENLRDDCTGKSCEVTELDSGKFLKNKGRNSCSFSGNKEDKMIVDSSEEIGVKNKRETSRSCVSFVNENSRRCGIVASVNESISKEVHGEEDDDGANLSNQNVKRRQGEVACLGNKEIDTKMKRKFTEEANNSVVWSKEEEVALHKAYFGANPTPRFWKKVSKLIPGKSAQDCFDKIHSELITPPQRQRRSRAIGINLSPIEKFSLSPSKLLEASEPKNKRFRTNKKKSHVTRKNARQLLQRHHKVNQYNEADLFSTLEPDINLTTQVLPDAMLSTPELLKEKQGLTLKCNEMSSAGPKNTRTRFSGSSRTAVASPPVLKQVKNKALHEKYIDQLHSRDAKRKAVSVKKKPNHNQNIDVVGAAKNALVSDARDFIDQFQHLQTNITSDSSYLDDNVGASGDDEDEIEI